MKKILPIMTTFLLLSLFLVSGCDALPEELGGEEDRGLTASGIVEALEIAAAPELSGRVVRVSVREGERVETGDVLFTMDNTLLTAQRAQAEARFESAQSALESVRAEIRFAKSSLTAAQAGVEAARLEYDQVLSEARAADAVTRVEDWNQDLPGEYQLPAWYFQEEETIAAARAEVDQAREAYRKENKNFHAVLEDIGGEDLLAAEKRLSEARAAFQVAEELLERDIGYEGKEELEDYARTLYDSAETELKAAQEAYNQLLLSTQADDLLEARARVSVAYERYQLALDNLESLFVGEHAYAVRAAEARLRAAEAGVDQARARLAQAEARLTSAENTVRESRAALDTIDIQLEKLIITSPISGVVLSRNIEPGEVIPAGMTALIIGDLEQLTVTVYLPEDRYGQIKIGDGARIQSDSFADIVFKGKVMRVADEAEYTPRNVQTREERQSTVYAVKLSVSDGQGRLKPGMPVDVYFGE